MSKMFISHATEDRDFLERELTGLLRALALDIWYAEEHIETAADWEREIVRGLEISKWFVVLLSPAAARSKWVKAEIGWAIDHRPNNIIPLVIADCQPHEFPLPLSNCQFIDFRTDRQGAREHLVKMLVEHEYKPRSLANVVSGLMECPSKEILLVIRMQARENEQVATIIGANALANRFFGRKANQSIVGTTLAHLFETMLPRWMDPEHLSAFVADQRRLHEAVLMGEEIYAKVPFRFNKNHPYYKEFAGDRYLPITIAYSNPIDEYDRTRVEDFLLLYANLDQIAPNDRDGAT